MLHFQSNLSNSVSRVLLDFVHVEFGIQLDQSSSEMDWPLDAFHRLDLLRRLVHRFHIRIVCDYNQVVLSSRLKNMFCFFKLCKLFKNILRALGSVVIIIIAATGSPIILGFKRAVNSFTTPLFFNRSILYRIVFSLYPVFLEISEADARASSCNIVINFLSRSSRTGCLDFSSITVSVVLDPLSREVSRHEDAQHSQRKTQYLG